MKKYGVLIVGAGNMGRSHALAYHQFFNCNILGIVSLGDSKDKLNQELEGGYSLYTDYYSAFQQLKPDITVISTYVDTHYDFTKFALNNNSHVFVEKPLCETLAKAQELIDLSLRKNLKMTVGYILRFHPGWNKFVEIAKTLGKPLVMRMNLNQQSYGKSWEIHKQLLKDATPIVDCGVHYVDVMSQMVSSPPIRVSGIQAGLGKDVSVEQINYGQLQVIFQDGSVGWYEAGWGPMMSETAYFIKDVIGPKGSVSIINDSSNDNSKSGMSSDVNRHVSNQKLKIHTSQLSDSGDFSYPDQIITLENEPDHDRLCQMEQEHLLQAIENDVDLSEELLRGLHAMKIVLAADTSAQTGKTIDFK